MLGDAVWARACSGASASGGAVQAAGSVWATGLPLGPGMCCVSRQFAPSLAVPHRLVSVLEVPLMSILPLVSPFAADNTREWVPFWHTTGLSRRLI